MPRRHDARGPRGGRAPAAGDRAGHRRGQQGRQREARARGGRVPLARLGGDLPISASHGRGTGDLLDAIVWALPPESEQSWRARRARPRPRRGPTRSRPGGWSRSWSATRRTATRRRDDGEADEATSARRSLGCGNGRRSRYGPAAIAFVGRPNVGKSSLLNALLGEERAIVSEVPGTTRDAIDTRLAWGRSEIVLIDTAGIRRRGKVASGPAAERYSTMRALTALSRADVAVLVIDAVEGLTVAGRPRRRLRRRGGEGPRRRGQQMGPRRGQDRPDLRPVRRVDPQRGRRSSSSRRSCRSARRRASASGRVLELAVDIWAERRRRVPTGELNRMLMAATERTPPPLVRGRRPEALLRHAGGDRAADVRVLRLGRGGGPFLVPAIPREPAARDVRVRRHADPARLPRPGVGEAAERRKGRSAPVAKATRLAPRRAAPDRPRDDADADRRSARRGRRGRRLGHDAGACIVAQARAGPAAAPAPEAAARDQADAPQRARGCPGIDLPGSSSRRPTPPPSRRDGPRDLRAPVGAPARRPSQRVAPAIPPSADVLSVVKGLERGTLLRMSRSSRRRRGSTPGRVAALSGPEPRRSRSPADCRRRRSSPRTTSSSRRASRSGSAAASSGST